MQYHEVASNPGRPDSEMVGTAGSSGDRFRGGAAVTEEVCPGFRFSVFSFVVRLLRPEAIRDLDLPRAL